MKVALSLCLCGVLLVASPLVDAGETTTLSTTKTNNTSNSSQHDPLSGQSSERMVETSSAPSKTQQETLQSTESFQSNRQQLYRGNEQSKAAAAGSAQSSSSNGQEKDQYDISQMIQTPSHFTFVSNQQISPEHVTMIGYTTPIVKAGGFIRVPQGENGKAVAASSSPNVAAPSPIAHTDELRNIQPLASSPPGENTLNDIQSQLLQYTSNSIYSTSEAQQKLQQQQMAKLIEAAALAAEKAPIRGLEGLMGNSQAQSHASSVSYFQMPQNEASERQPQQQAQVHELAEDFPSKMNYKNYEQHTRLPYRVQNEEEAKNSGAFSAPLDKPKPFIVYKPGYDKIANIEPQGGFQPVLPSSIVGGGGPKPLTIIADKSLSVISDVNNELTSNGPTRSSFQYLNMQSPPPAPESEAYGQQQPAKASYPKLAEGFESLAAGRPPLEPSSFMTTNSKGMPVQATLGPAFHHEVAHHSHYPRANQGQHFYKPQTVPSHSRPLEYTFGQKIQLEPPGGRTLLRSLPMQSSPNEEQTSVGGSKYDPKSELLNQINFMLTNSPNLSEESRGKHRSTIESTLKQVEEAFGGKSAKIKMMPAGASSGNQFGRYREMFTQEEPIKLVSTVNKVPQTFSMPAPPAPSAAIQQVYPPQPPTHHVSPHQQQALHQLQAPHQHQAPHHHHHHHHHQAPQQQHYNVPTQANSPVKYDDFPSELYHPALPEYGTHLKSDRLQQKIQQFVNEQMLAEEKKNGAASGTLALAPHLLAGTPQAAYLQKYAAKLNNYGKLQMIAPAGTQTLTIDSNLVANPRPASSDDMPPHRYTLARGVGQVPSAPVQTHKSNDPSNAAFATYFSQQQRLAAASANPYRNQLTTDQLTQPMKPVRGNSEWWKETSAESNPSNYYLAL